MRRALGWLGDTLARRLFWLLWLALVVSHLIAFLTVSALQGREGAALALHVVRHHLDPGAAPLEVLQVAAGLDATDPEGE